MANTVIQLKFSTITATPTSLNIGEPAYSYTSNVFFIGSPDGTGSIAIGGKFYLDQQQLIYDHANAAFGAANNVAPQIEPAFSQANAAFIHANSAFDAANNEAGVNATQNTNIGIAQNTADAAFIRANNSLNANAGGTIDGDLTVTGNLNIIGNTVSYNVSTYTVNDPIIVLANNSFSDVLDIGFTAHYSSDTINQIHTGLIRHAATDKYYLFEGYGPHLLDDNILDVDDPSLIISTLKANLETQLITLNGQNLQLYVDNSFNHANGAFDAANNEAGVNATQNNSIAASFIHANSAFDAANNEAGVNATQNNSIAAAFNHANAAFDHANTDFTNISISASDYGTASEVTAFRVESNGRISSANSTSIAIATSQIISGTLGVDRGGTGANTFTTNGVLLGQGTSAFTTTSSSTEGHVLTINDTGVPTFAHLSGGTF
jgi:hypothetical protein